ncbi:protein ABIL2 isoform X2 [Eucalyptus grandis]|uniref:protein ABIL2 isoform X2 n=1 Tax=Eucalyptus grandis TaxID=71139 RepID=UPI00192EACE8|nr:protein ABIL2 isoform X2 [Eucalyptus grandis]
MTRLGKLLQLTLDSRVQQRQRMCEMSVDHGGLSQQSLAIRTPKHHMRYILPGMLPFTTFVIGLLRPKDRSRFMLKNFLSVSKAKDGGDNKNLRYCVTNEVNGEISAVYPRNIETSASIVRRRHLATQFPQSSRTGPFSFASTLSNKKAEKRTSPFLFQLTRSSSLADKSTTPNPSNAKKRYPSEPQRSTSMSTHVERNRRTDIELCSSKNKSLFKALLSMRKSRKDSKLYKFLDEK